MKTGLPRHLMITYCHTQVNITVATRYSGRKNTMRYQVTYILALRDGTKTDFDLSLGQDIRRGGHVNQEVC